jgi:hypothetical protein
MEPTAPNNAALRRSVYALLICIGLGAVIGRILAVDSVDMVRLADYKFATDAKLAKKLADKRTAFLSQGLSGLRLDYAVLEAKTELAVEAGLTRPFLSANDRSRWCTVRALVEPEMRVPGAPYAIDMVVGEHDVNGKKVKNCPGWDTIDKVYHDGHYYSSKPPLLSTLMAAEYWIIFNFAHKSLSTHPYEVGRFMMITINGTCLLLLFVFTARLIERLGTTDWGRIFVMAGCVFGTFLTTFAVTITNHLPAAACTAVLLDALVRIWLDGDRRAWTFIVAGFSSGMLAGNEIPAGLLSAVATLVLLRLSPKKTLIAFLPPALLVTAAFFGTNWIAVHDLKPAQMHRGMADNWYDYPGSYWNAKQGIDAGETSTGVYALHVLVGHHGVFALTPIWLLFLLGAGIWLVRGSAPPPRDGQETAVGRPLRWLALWGLIITLICFAFYIWFDGVDRNYGGNASAFRWVFWLAPLWLVLMLPAADLLSRRGWTRAIGLLLLATSALSCHYPTWNPWSAPWIMNFLGSLGRL